MRYLSRVEQWLCIWKGWWRIAVFMARSIPRAPADGKGVSVWIYRFWKERFTRTGRAAVIVALTLSILEMAPGISGAFYLSWILWCALGVSWIMTSRSPPLEARWFFPPDARQEEVFIVRVVLRNIGKHALRGAGVSFVWEQLFLRPVFEPEECVIQPGETREFQLRLKGAWRGPCPVRGPLAYVAHPLGLMRSRLKISQPADFTLQPSWLRVREMPFLRIGLRARFFIAAYNAAFERGEDFIGIRRFRDGDSVRSIHQRAWAKVGYPMVREYESIHQGKGIIVVLMTKADNFAERAALEAAISLADGIARLLREHKILERCFIDNREVAPHRFSAALARIERPLWWPRREVVPWRMTSGDSAPILAISCAREELDLPQVVKGIWVTWNSAPAVEDDGRILVWNPSRMVGEISL